jgi:hypothetical protein
MTAGRGSRLRWFTLATKNVLLFILLLGEQDVYHRWTLIRLCRCAQQNILRDIPQRSVTRTRGALIRGPFANDKYCILCDVFVVNDHSSCSTSWWNLVILVKPCIIWLRESRTSYRNVRPNPMVIRIKRSSHT